MRFRQVWDYVQNTPMNTNPKILQQMIKEYAEFEANPLSKYTLDVDISDEVDLFGKKASDLQEKVTIVDGKFFGYLNYIENYTGFSGNPEEQNGFYVVFHIAYDGADYIKVNGVTLDEDGIHILFLRNPYKKNTAVVEIKKGNNVLKDTLDFSGLYLGDKDEPLNYFIPGVKPVPRKF